MVDKVKGYKDLTQDKVEIVNQNKLSEEYINRLIEDLADREESMDLDVHALYQAQTKFTEAWMWLNRGVFNPSRIELPEDKVEAVTE